MTTDETTDAPNQPDGHPTDDALRRELHAQTDPEESARITDHLDACEQCGERLDALADTMPALSAEATATTDDPGWMRRAVSRTLFGVAWRAALLLAVVAIGGQFLGALVIHPLLVDRGDRLEEHLVAAIDLPVLLRPGVEASEIRTNPGVFRRSVEVRFERAVGAQHQDLGSYELRLGPLGMSRTDGPLVAFPPLGPSLSNDPSDRSTIAFDPSRAGEATAATVELRWFEGIDATQVPELTADAGDELALTWVGFQVGEPPEDPDLAGAYDATLGYSACPAGADRLREIIGDGPIHGGGGMSGGFRAFPPEPGDGVAQALAQVRRATANLASSGWLEDAGSVRDGLGDVQETARWLEDNDPDVTSVVLTGPTTLLAEVVEASGPDRAVLLELELDRGAPDPCG